MEAKTYRPFIYQRFSSWLTFTTGGRHNRYFCAFKSSDASTTILGYTPSQPTIREYYVITVRHSFLNYF